MDARSALLKTRMAIDLFKPILDLEEVLTDLAANEGLILELRRQEAEIRKRVGALHEEKRGVEDLIAREKDLENVDHAARIQKVNSEFTAKQAAIMARISDLQVHEREAHDRFKQISFNHDLAMAGMKEEKEKAQAELTSIREEVDKIRSRFQ